MARLSTTFKSIKPLSKSQILPSPPSSSKNYSSSASESPTKNPWTVYLILSTNPPIKTYVGVTNDFSIRLKQHNGEVKGGAKASRAGRPWICACLIQGFINKSKAYEFESKWKNISRKLSHKRCSKNQEQEDDYRHFLLQHRYVALNKDVGYSILESYSRVMESLAFNIIARIDVYVLYVDDATRRCAAAAAMSIFNRGGGFNGLPVQKKMSPSPFSIQHTPYASPFATPTFCSSPPLPCSPRSVTPLNRSTRAANHKHDKVVPADLEKLWSYAGNLGSRRVSGDAPERD